MGIKARLKNAAVLLFLSLTLTQKLQEQFIILGNKLLFFLAKSYISFMIVNMQQQTRDS